MFILILQSLCQDAKPCNKKEEYCFPVKRDCVIYSHLSGNVFVKTKDFISLSADNFVRVRSANCTIKYRKAFL